MLIFIQELKQAVSELVSLSAEEIINNLGDF